MIHPVQEDRYMCEVPGCDSVGTDWDHCIFKRNKRFSKFVDNPFNMLRACALCNRITKRSDFWITKKWLIDYHMENNQEEFLKWIENPPSKFAPVDMFVIYDYIKGEVCHGQYGFC